MSDPVTPLGGDAAHDVVIVGDGPAGSALANACSALGVDTLLVGDDAPWSATYGTWCDDLERATLLGAADVTAGNALDVRVWTDRRHELGRPYVLLDNDALRVTLRAGVDRRTDRVTSIVTGPDRHRVRLDGGDEIACRLVVDTTGWPPTFAIRTHRSAPPFWQTALGVVLPEPPTGDLGSPTLMDFRDPPRTAAASRARTASSFAYSLPVADGWLVEETVLAARPAVEPMALLPLLAARLHLEPDAMLERAVRTEYVRIPMGTPRPRRDQPIVAFGAAAGYVNPTSGYSVVHSIQMAPPVAAAISRGLEQAAPGRTANALPVWNAVWPVAHRRTRVLHDYGLDTLGRLDGPALRQFFAAFFDLPTPTWSTYMRATTPPSEISRVMTRLFAAAPWSTRRRLATGNPAAFARLIRPN